VIGSAPADSHSGGAEVDESAWGQLGRFCGHVMAPITGFVSRVRQARMFHPDGLVFRGTVEAVDASPDLRLAGKRLAGSALVRLSSALWRGDKQWIDVLGMAVRFRRPSSNGVHSQAGDQDLLLATIRFSWTTPFAPFATNVSSFLWNHFHAVSPFLVDQVGRVKLRFRSPRIPNKGGLSRGEHLREAVASGSAVYELEARRITTPVLRRSWERVARLTLTDPIEVDQAALRFSPFLDGRGLHPKGFVHHLRVGTYAASQRARPG
jgi:hypothetical protein